MRRTIKKLNSALAFALSMTMLASNVAVADEIEAADASERAAEQDAAVEEETYKLYFPKIEGIKYKTDDDHPVEDEEEESEAREGEEEILYQSAVYAPDEEVSLKIVYKDHEAADTVEFKDEDGEIIAYMYDVEKERYEFDMPESDVWLSLTFPEDMADSVDNTDVTYEDGVVANDAAVTSDEGQIADSDLSDTDADEVADPAAETSDYTPQEETFAQTVEDDGLPQSGSLVQVATIDVALNDASFSASTDFRNIDYDPNTQSLSYISDDVNITMEGTYSSVYRIDVSGGKFWFVLRPVRVSTSAEGVNVDTFSAEEAEEVIDSENRLSDGDVLAEDDDSADDTAGDDAGDGTGGDTGDTGEEPIDDTDPSDDTTSAKTSVTVTYTWVGQDENGTQLCSGGGTMTQEAYDDAETFKQTMKNSAAAESDNAVTSKAAELGYTADTAGAEHNFSDPQTDGNSTTYTLTTIYTLTMISTGEETDAATYTYTTNYNFGGIVDGEETPIVTGNGSLTNGTTDQEDLGTYKADQASDAMDIMNEQIETWAEEHGYTVDTTNPQVYTSEAQGEGETANTTTATISVTYTLTKVETDDDDEDPDETDPTSTDPSGTDPSETDPTGETTDPSTEGSTDKTGETGSAGDTTGETTGTDSTTDEGGETTPKSGDETGETEKKTDETGETADSGTTTDPSESEPTSEKQSESDTDKTADGTKTVVDGEEETETAKVDDPSGTKPTGDETEKTSELETEAEVAKVPVTLHVTLSGTDDETAGVSLYGNRYAVYSDESCKSDFLLGRIAVDENGDGAAIDAADSNGKEVLYLNPTKTYYVKQYMSNGATVQDTNYKGFTGTTDGEGNYTLYVDLTAEIAKGSLQILDTSEDNAGKTYVATYAETNGSVAEPITLTTNEYGVAKSAENVLLGGVWNIALADDPENILGSVSVVDGQYATYAPANEADGKYNYTITIEIRDERGELIANDTNAEFAASIVKEDEAGNTVQETAITLYKVSTATNEIIPAQQLTMGDSGVISMAGSFEPGTKVRVKETKAPTGYNLNSKVIDLTTSTKGEPGTLTYTFNHTVRETIVSDGTITVRVTDGNGNALGSGINVTLTPLGTENGTTQETGDAGETSYSVPVGQYTVTLSNVPDGYAVPDAVTVKLDSASALAEIPLSRTSVVINRLLTDGTVLENSVYLLLTETDANSGTIAKIAEKIAELRSKNASDWMGELQSWLAENGYPTDLSSYGPTYTTGEDGSLTVDGLSHGKTYYLVETATPQGASVDDTVHKVVVDESGKINASTIMVTSVQSDRVGTVTVACTLKDATVEIQTADGTVLDTFTTAGGSYVLTGLPKGEYKVVQTAVPTGYVAKTESFTISDDNMNAIVTLNNNQIFVNVSLADADTGNLVSGGTFEVKDKDGNVVDSWENDGSAHSFVATIGAQYTVTETKAPTGYVATSDKELTAGLDTDAGQTSSLTIKNYSILASVSLLDSESKEYLTGATLTITDKDGKTIDSWTTNEKAHMVTLPVGTYTLTETAAPEKYATAANIVFKIAETSAIQKVTMYNNLLKIEISNLIPDSETLVAGSELSIIDAKGNTVETWTADGSIHTVNLPVGEYTLKETKAPNGYTLADAVAFTVKDTADVQEVKLYEKALTITIYKKDKVTDKNLAGAELKLSTTDGTELAAWTSDEEGKELQVPAGTLVLTEVAAPEGYELAKSIEITVEDGKEGQEYTLYNAPKDDLVNLSGKSVKTTVDANGNAVSYTDANGNTITPNTVNGTAGTTYTSANGTAVNGTVTSDGGKGDVATTAAKTGDVFRYLPAILSIGGGILLILVLFIFRKRRAH